ncbi:MAG: class I SAM-dependent methyltransferase [Clostridia bacterium]|nr:class I SAM-dependent methyltransferase [Clostridia bacterium]
MNSVWSDNVQGILTLYLSRKLRFDDLFFEQYRNLFNLDQDKELRILEIGCGPGALAEALHRWYPKAEIIGVDRDTKFIEFAKANISGVTFLEGDATNLPFEDNTFDITISNTVQEHIDPSVFWGEQNVC